MTDFVGRVLRPEHPDWIIHSRLDVDFYMFTMFNFVRQKYPGTKVRMKFTNRHLHIPVADVVDEEELRRQLDHACTLRFNNLTHNSYIRGMDVYGDRMFPESTILALKKSVLAPYTLKRVGDQYDFEAHGDWEDAMWWECAFLCIITELFSRALNEAMLQLGPEGVTALRVLYARATDKAYEFFKSLTTRPRIRLALFGLRRRHSFLWERFITEMAQEVLGKQLAGTSTMSMAFEKGLIPTGTIAHQVRMAIVAMARKDGPVAMRAAQYRADIEWMEVYLQEALRILLTDPYGSDQYYGNMPDDLAAVIARGYRGERFDSGLVIPSVHKYVSWLKRFGENPKDHLGIPSDGLNRRAIFEIDDAVGDILPLSFGVGTHATNGFEGCHPFGDQLAVIRGKQLKVTWGQLYGGHSFICKLLTVNDAWCVKLSNNPNKHTGPEDEVAYYQRPDVFGVEGQVSQKIEV